MNKDKRITQNAPMRPLVPRLRFPEFARAGEWEVKRLGDVCDLYQPAILSTSVFSERGEYFVYGANGIIGKYSQFNHEFSEVAVTCRGATCGEVHFTKPKSWITGNAMIVTPRIFELSKNYIYYLLLAFDLKTVISGSAQPQITRQGFAPFLIYFPTVLEQQRIADCLTSLDENITAQGHKLDTLKAHKKGLMQKLFPAEGERVPELRFNEFAEDGEWEVKKIEEIGKVITGNTPSTAISEYYGGARQFVSPADISDLKYIVDTKTKLSESGFAQGRIIPAFSTLFVCIGSTIGKVAQNTKECITNQQINSIVPEHNNSHGFVYYVLSQYSEAIASIAGKHAVPIINKTSFSLYNLLVPKPKEQQRIADCLTSLDELITAQTRKLELLKEHKKGLMQQLFPTY